MTPLEGILDTNSKDWIGDELRTKLLLGRDMDGMRIWANQEYKQHIDHALQSSAPAPQGAATFCPWVMGHAT